jgi:hypothetical protein
MKYEIILSIAGEIVPVLFDGNKVSTMEFPEEPIDFTSRCGLRITQEMLVDICDRKLQNKKSYE